jgi:hypothetical protein
LMPSTMPASCEFFSLFASIEASRWQWQSNQIRVSDRPLLKLKHIICTVSQSASRESKKKPHISHLHYTSSQLAITTNARSSQAARRLLLVMALLCLRPFISVEGTKSAHSSGAKNA